MPGNPVQSVERALEILMVFREGETMLSVTEISRRINLAPSTTHRLLNTLLSHQFIEKHEGNQYGLGIRLLELGRRVQVTHDLRRIALPEMRQLANTSGQSVTLFVLNNGQALCLERMPGPNPIQVFAVDVGGRLPLNSGAGPRVLLAALSDDEIARMNQANAFPRFTDRTVAELDAILADAHQTRSQGYVLAVEDVVDSVAAIGAPLRDAAGQWVGAIGLVGIVPEMNGNRRDSLIQAVCKSAEVISTRLGYRPKL